MEDEIFPGGIFLAKGDGETLAEHTKRLLKLLDNFLSVYGARFSERQKQQLRLVCLWHDRGKINSSFQNFLYRKWGKEVPAEFCDLTGYRSAQKWTKIPHGILSCLFIHPEEYQKKGIAKEDAEILISAVYTHHAKAYFYPKFGVSDLPEPIKDDLKRNGKFAGFGDGLHSTVLLMNAVAEHLGTASLDYGWWLKFVWIKGHLNRLDYAASARMDQLEIPPSDAAAETAESLARKGFEMRDCQRYLLERQDKNVVMTASTGIGKTEAALLWSGAEKTFYTLPVKVSINAMYERIRSERYYPMDMVALLHGDAMAVLLRSEQEETSADAFSALEKMRLFQYPMTVCTVDQLFQFVSRSLGTEVPAAVLGCGKVILDEIQAYSPEILARILFALKIVTDLGGKFLIMTATLPPHIKEYFQKERIPCEIDAPFFSELLRHRICLQHCSEFDFPDIARRAERNKVLVICNTVRRAQKVYRTLKEAGAEPNLLHSRFIGKDRAEKEAAILEFASRDGAGIWVTTQLVEASLDIDFDLLFTEMSSADSLLQRMGRCYRKREWNSAEPNIFIINSKSGCGRVYDSEIYARSWEKLLPYDGKMMSERDKQDYIDRVYCTEEIAETEYYSAFKKELRNIRELQVAALSAEDAKTGFRSIDSVTVIPCCFSSKAEELSEELDSCRDRQKKIRIRDEIRKFTLQIPPDRRSYRYESEKKIPEYPICINQYSAEYGLLTEDMEDGSGKFE